VPTHLFVSASTVVSDAPRPCLLENRWETHGTWGIHGYHLHRFRKPRKLLREMGKNFPNSATQWGFARKIFPCSLNQNHSVFFADSKTMFGSGAAA
jgi:hypothetical protein